MRLHGNGKPDVRGRCVLACVLRVRSEHFKLDYVEFEADVWTSKGGKYCTHVNISLQQLNVNIVPVSSGTLFFV